MLGIAADDSDDDPEDEDEDEDDSKSMSAAPETAVDKPPSSGEGVRSHEEGVVRESDVPEGLPEGFFDAPEQTVRTVTTEGHDPSEDPRIPGTGKAERIVDPRRVVEPKAQKLDPARAAKLEAEAAAEAERDEERLAAMRTARLMPPQDPATEEDPTLGGDAGGADESAPVEEGAAGGGSALPEGFFDDPEVGKVPLSRRPYRNAPRGVNPCSEFPGFDRLMRDHGRCDLRELCVLSGGNL